MDNREFEDTEKHEDLISIRNQTNKPKPNQNQTKPNQTKPNQTKPNKPKTY